MKLQEMRRNRKQLIEQRFEARLAIAAHSIRMQVIDQVMSMEYVQQRRELNQQLRELASRLAGQTDFSSCRTIRQGRKEWLLIEIFRLHRRRYHLSSHSHVMYEDWDSEDSYWPKWFKVEHGNKDVTNRQMMSIIRKLEAMLA